MEDLWEKEALCGVAVAVHLLPVGVVEDAYGGSVLVDDEKALFGGCNDVLGLMLVVCLAQLGFGQGFCGLDGSEETGVGRDFFFASLEGKKSVGQLKLSADWGKLSADLGKLSADLFLLPLGAVDGWKGL